MSRRDSCDRTCACLHTCKIPSTSEKSPVLASLITVQSRIPDSNFVVATATLLTVVICFHTSVLSCFILNETFDMLQQQENQMFQFDRLVLMFKIISKICPESLPDIFAERSTISKYGTRNKTDLQIPRLI